MGETGGVTAEQNGLESFNPLQCLFCRQQASSIDSSVQHMLKRHGLFIENKSRLIVEADTILEYLHFIISTYCECIYCGTQRSSPQAIRQHMISKSHCKIDVSREDSEFRDFYDYSQDTSDVQKEDRKKELARITHVDESYGPTRKDRKHRLCRPKSSTQANDTLDWKPSEPASATTDANCSSISMTRAEKRGGVVLTKQLSQIRASDRTSLQHLPASQQHALLGTYQQSVSATKREESRKQTRLERAVNKTLVQTRYYKTETPVYQCG